VAEAKADREFERVWSSVSKFWRLLIIYKPCMRGELNNEDTEQGPIPAPSFDTEYDDGLRDDIEQDINLDKDTSPATDRARRCCSSRHTRQRQSTPHTLVAKIM
jgi:hypothetical protein